MQELYMKMPKAYKENWGRLWGELESYRASSLLVFLKQIYLSNREGDRKGNRQLSPCSFPKCLGWQHEVEIDENKDPTHLFQVNDRDTAN